jgi:hypothetical protein
MKLNNAEAVVQQKRSLRAKGIGYDTGFNSDGVTRRPFNHEVVRRELQIIRDDLHCTAVRLFGDDLDRLDFAARHAAELSLFNTGFLPGDSLEERVGNLLGRQPETPQLLAGLPARINDFLAKADRLRTGPAIPGAFLV